jgi:Mg2+ and Co2+ transporter CorA
MDVHSIPTIALLRLASAEWLTMSQYIKTRLSQIDWEITHPKEFLTQTQIDIILNKLHTWRRLVPLYREMITDTQTRLFNTDNAPKPCPLDPFRVEFRLVLAQMEEYERRIDRLTTVVTSAISIVDSRRVERLTLLAMLFVPLSLVGTLFSMSDDITGIRDTFGYWAIASASCVVLMFVWTAWSRKQSLKAR